MSYKYLIKYLNGKIERIEKENLDGAYEHAIPNLKQTGDMARITTPNGNTFRVIKDGSWHWIHNGYSFG